MVVLVSLTPPLGSEPLCHPLPAHSGPNRETVPLGWGRGSLGKEPRQTLCKEQGGVRGGGLQLG